MHKIWVRASSQFLLSNFLSVVVATVLQFQATRFPTPLFPQLYALLLPRKLAPLACHVLALII